ncbi:MAG: phage portal protein [Gemmatimonadota bacterium]
MSRREWADRLGRAADRLMGVFQPERAARRVLFREHFSRMADDPDYRSAVLLGLRLQGYRAARSGASQTPWSGGGGSADAELSGDLPAMRNRSRELNRDDPLASGLTKSIVSGVVGTGLVPQAKTGEPARDKALEAVWAARQALLAPADGLTHCQAQALYVRKYLEDGEVLVKAAKRGPSDPVWFETVEADRLATPRARSADKAVRDGVEKDAWGVPVAYHVAVSHPGETMRSGGAKYLRVPADVVRHWRRVERPGQTRGVPAFHAILQDLHDLDLLLLASLKRVQISACLAVFIKSARSMPEIASVTAQQYGYKLDQPIEPGMIFKLFPDEDVQTLIPGFPTPELVPFVVMLCRRIGAALGVSWQIVLKDFSGSTYSSARTDILETRTGCYDVIQSALVELLLDWQWLTVQQDALLRGEPLLLAAGVQPEDLDKVEWIPPARPWVDPLKEGEAVRVQLEIGVTSLHRECAVLGRDWRTVLEERLLEEAEETKRRRELGLPPRQVKAPAAPGGNGSGKKPPPDDEDEDRPPPRRGLAGLVQPTSRWQS